LSGEQVDIIVTHYDDIKKSNPKIKQLEAKLDLEKNHKINISIATYGKVIKGKY